jgi:Na+/proline symporter
MASVLAGAPLLALLMATGSLLYLFYHGLGGGPASPPALGAGGGIPLLARFIMTETPPGLRGLATAGVLATAVGSTTSALNAMSSVMVEDFYRPWRFRRGGRSEAHLVMAGRAGVVVTGLATLGVAVASFYWQRSSNAPLLEFVLSVMTFAYAGLLGVFLTALFTRRGNSRSACAGLAVGFATILALQPGLADQLPLFGSVGRLAFPWRLCMGAAVSFVVCFWGRADRPGAATAVTRPPPEWDARRPRWSGEESA